MPIPMIIDCDPGIDDMVALLVACASPEVELLGVSTVAGNVDPGTATANALSVLALAGRPDVPVAQGCGRPLVRPRRHQDRPAHAADGFGGARFPASRAEPAREHAVEMLARLAAPPARPVTLVAIGPLTNVALFYALHPQLAARLDRLVVMGGAIGAGNTTPAAEFNIWSDPEAAYRVLTSTGLPRTVPTTMVGLDVTRRTRLTAQDHERIRRAGPIGQLAASALDGYAHGMPGAGVPVHDAVALVAAIRPGLVVTEPSTVEVDFGPGPSVGNTLVTALAEGAAGAANAAGTTNAAGADGVDEAGGDAADEPGCRVAVDIDAGGVVAFVVDRVTSLDAR